MGGARACILAAVALSIGWGGSYAWVLPQGRPHNSRGVSSLPNHASVVRATRGRFPESMINAGGGAIGLGERRSHATTLMAAVGAAPLAAKLGASYDVDVAVIGGGPAGSAMAALLAQQHQLKVVLMDPKLDARWLPNYGVWLEEWQALEKILGFSVEGCLMKVWPKTDLFCGGSHGIPVDERLRVNRPYGRVDRAALKSELRRRAADGGATLIKAAVDVDTVVHDTQGSTFRCDDGSKVRTKLILDCSGFASKLVQLEGDAVPGVQVAYGIEAECDVCPYDEQAMTLMDYRTDYLSNPADLEVSSREPTFLYAMPMGGEAGSKRIFFEETSLVARPPMTFEECKRRMDLRLKHLGVKVLKVEEEEFCYIPMGGSLPKANQRIVAFGGAMALVHPSTGYHICRALAASGPCAATIAKEVKRGAAFNPDYAAKAVYDTIWNRTTRLQRDFTVFGGEFLMVQPAANLRGFFDSFFKLPEGLWAGFLAGWPGLPNNEYHETWEGRLLFGIRLFLLAPLPLKFALAQCGVLMGGIPFFRCVTPFAMLIGEPADEPLTTPPPSAPGLSQ